MHEFQPLNADQWTAIFTGLGVIVNGFVVWAAFRVQRRQVQADRALVDRDQDLARLAAYSCIHQTVAAVQTARDQLKADLAKARVLTIRRKLSWMISEISYYLEQDLPDYDLLRELLRTQDMLQTIRDVVDKVIAADGGPAYQTMSAMLPGTFNTALGGLLEMNQRILRELEGIRARLGMPMMRFVPDPADSGTG